MLHILVAYDDEDSNRGEYFSASKENLIFKLLPNPSINLQLLNTRKCLANSVDFYVKKYGGKSFIFIAYAHGSEKALLVGGIEFVNIPITYFFNQSLFYACGCFAANELGKALIHNGCRVFLGYNDKISTGNNETEPIFYECENAFITHFLTSGNTIQSCLDFMYDKYQERVNYLNKYASIFDASILDRNLSAFEIICKEEDYQLTKNDFI